MAGLAKKDRDLIEKLPSNMEIGLTDYIKFLYKEKWKIKEYSFWREINRIWITFKSTTATYKDSSILITIQPLKKEEPYKILGNWMFDDDPEAYLWNEQSNVDVDYEVDPSELDEKLNDYIYFYEIDYARKLYGHYKTLHTIK